jgi:hypothetical protein
VFSEELDGYTGFHKEKEKRKSFPTASTSSDADLAGSSNISALSLL